MSFKVLLTFLSCSIVSASAAGINFTIPGNAKVCNYSISHLDNEKILAFVTCDGETIFSSEYEITSFPYGTDIAAIDRLSSALASGFVGAGFLLPTCTDTLLKKDKFVQILSVLRCTTGKK